MYYKYTFKNLLLAVILEENVSLKNNSTIH